VLSCQLWQCQVSKLTFAAVTFQRQAAASPYTLLTNTKSLPSGLATCLINDIPIVMKPWYTVWIYLAANLLLNSIGSDGDGVGLLPHFAGLQVEVGCCLCLVADEAQHALLRHKAAAAMPGTHCQAHLHQPHVQACTQPIWHDKSLITRQMSQSEATRSGVAVLCFDINEARCVPGSTRRHASRLLSFMTLCQGERLRQRDSTGLYRCPSSQTALHSIQVKLMHANTHHPCRRCAQAMLP